MYVITEPCIGSKDGSCVEVCPVDCIHPTADEAGFDDAPQLYIDPEACIGCGACEGACPVQAIYPIGEVPDELRHFTVLNAEYFADQPAT